MKTAIKKILTIPKSITGKEDLIIIPRSQYEQIIANAIPSFYLKGKSARLLDNRVKKGLKEHKEKKIIKAGSLSEAISLFGKQENA